MEKENKWSGIPVGNDHPDKDNDNIGNNEHQETPSDLDVLELSVHTEDDPFLRQSGIKPNEPKMRSNRLASHRISNPLHVSQRFSTVATLVQRRKRGLETAFKEQPLSTKMLKKSKVRQQVKATVSSIDLSEACLPDGATDNTRGKTCGNPIILSDSEWSILQSHGRCCSAGKTLLWL